MMHIPKDWELVPLGKLGRYINGMAFKPSDWEKTGLPIIRIQNLTNPNAPFNYYSKPVKERYYVRNGDLLISWSATLGAYLWDRGDAILNQHIFRVEVNEERVDKKFLMYAVKQALDQLQKRTHGATMRHVTKRDFESFEVPVPRSLAEQRRIVARIEALLGEVRAARALHEEIVRDTGRLMDAVLAEVFPQPDQPLPSGWRLKRVKDISRKPQYGYTKSASKIPIGPKFLRITDIQNGKVDWDTVPYCECDPSCLKKYQLHSGDIVFARSGATTGKTYLVKNPPEAVFASYLIRLRIIKALPGFVWWFFQSPYYWRQIVPRGGALPNVNAKTLQEILIPIHEDEDVQRNIIKRLESIRAEIDEMEKTQTENSKLLDEMEQAILAQAFRGEL